MNSIQQAIEKSIEGRYHKRSTGLDDGKYLMRCFLDPEWWQSLGKALGRCDVNDINPLHKIENKVICVVCKRKDEWWRETWHRFIDHLSEDKDPEEFFKELLK